MGTGDRAALRGAARATGFGQGELLQKWARDAKILDLFEGTQQIQLLIIARALLGEGSAELRERYDRRACARSRSQARAMSASVVDG